MSEKKTATLSVVVRYDPDQATPLNLARAFGEIVEYGIDMLADGITACGCGHFRYDKFRVTKAEDYKTHVEDHDFWERAALNGLIDSVGSVEWMRIKAGTRFVSDGWLSDHQRMLDNKIIPLER